VELTGAPAPGQLRDNLARALGDQSLELAFWLPGRAGFADPGGRQVQLPPAGSGRAVTRVERDGWPIAALIHDPALEQDPELIAGVGAAAALALEAERRHPPADPHRARPGCRHRDARRPQPTVSQPLGDR
jgi:hypothetical protein